MYLGRTNIAGSKESLKNAAGGSLKNADSADGYEKVKSPSMHSNNAVSNVPAQHVQSVKTDASPAADNSKLEVQKNHTPFEKVVSPRQRLMSIVSGDSQPVQSSSPDQPTQSALPAQPAQATNGLPMDSIPNDSEVYITHVKNNRIVYIRSVATDEEYTKLITEVDAASKTAPKLTDFPAKNDMIMAPFDGMFYRALVVNADKQGKNIHLFYQ